MLEHAATAHDTEEVHDVGIIAVRYDPDVWQLRRKQVPRPKHFVGLPCRDSVASQAMNEDYIGLRLVRSLNHDLHASFLKLDERNKNTAM